MTKSTAKEIAGYVLMGLAVVLLIFFLGRMFALTFQC
jgi:hypothetical protein